MNDTAAERLKAARTNAGFTSAKAASEALGVPLATYTQHENGTRNIPRDKAPLYARRFKVTEEWLLYGKGEPQSFTPEGAEGIVEFTLLGDVPAGNWQEAIQKSRNKVPVPAFDAPPQGYALRVQGDSMDLVVPSGTVIIVDPNDREFWPGKCYVVMNEHGETTFKRYMENPKRLVPCSSNPEHKEMLISDGGYRTLGRVVWQGGRL